MVAMELMDSCALLTVVRRALPGNATVGTTVFSTSTCLVAWLHLPRKLHSVTVKL